jgi:hypothetical protein
MNSSEDYNELVNQFVETCKDITVYHHDEIQSVDTAINKPEFTEDDDEDGCTFCCRPYNNETRKPEYNHSHFVDDNLNTQYNKYICSECNKKAMLRNKPLKFYAHNGSKYDNNLFLPKFLNDPQVRNHEFLNKTESRFTEVKLGFARTSADIEFDKWGNAKCKYKLSFNDSMLLLQGPLSKLCSAWVNKTRDGPLLKKMLKIFYTDIEDVEPLVKQSFGKQVFPYTALNNIELIDQCEPIEKKYFENTFVNKECSDDDYKSYLEANKVLQETIGASTYCFGDYHDYYLLLDVVLLGVILYNFMNLNHTLNGINPLSFLSTSSYSFNAL